jgi:hypothetical protein
MSLATTSGFGNCVVVKQANGAAGGAAAGGNSTTPATGAAANATSTDATAIASAAAKKGKNKGAAKRDHRAVVRSPLSASDVLSIILTELSTAGLPRCTSLSGGHLRRAGVSPSRSGAKKGRRDFIDVDLSGCAMKYFILFSSILPLATYFVHGSRKEENHGAANLQ